MTSNMRNTKFILQILFCLHLTGWIKTRPVQKLLVRVKLFTGNSYSYRKELVSMWTTTIQIHANAFTGTRTRTRIAPVHNGSGYVYIDTSTSTSPECGFQFTARTSFTHTSERSWSLVQAQLNACLPTISRKIESRKCFAKK